MVTIFDSKNHIMSNSLIAAIGIFVFMTWFMYKGAVGRMERKNTFSKKPQFNLGELSDKEVIAIAEGKHKTLALKQAIIGAFIYGLIVYGIVELLF